MGRLLPFRRRRRLKGLSEFDRGQRIRFWPDKQRITPRGLVRDTGRWLGRLRPFILGAVLLTIWPAMDPALIEPPGFLSGDPVTVDAQFTRCPGRACVVDGDTFRIGDKRIRVIGIDAPETHPAGCAEEARLGEQATVKLQELLNQGPFEMTGRIDDMTDRYGRHRRVITRTRPDGSEQSIADDMQGAGLANAYRGGFKNGWC